MCFPRAGLSVPGTRASHWSWKSAVMIGSQQRLRSIMVETTSTVEGRPHQGVMAAFEKFEREGQSRTPSWLQALHKGGIAHFAELGFPTRAHEEWRFTNISPIAR